MNHSPEGTLATVSDLKNIEDWWDSKWDTEY